MFSVIILYYFTYCIFNKHCKSIFLYLFVIYMFHWYICKIHTQWVCNALWNREILPIDQNQPNNACCHYMAQRSARHGGSDVFASGQALGSWDVPRWRPIGDLHGVLVLKLNLATTSIRMLISWQLSLVVGPEPFLDDFTGYLAAIKHGNWSKEV